MTTIQDDLDIRLSARLKAERDARGWSLAELAGRAGVSKAMISKLERGESSPTAALLGRLSGAFGLTLSQLMARAEASVRPLARRSEQASWRDPATGFTRRTLTPASGEATALELVWGELPPGAAIAYPASAFTFIQDQQIVVIQGALSFTQGSAVHDLGQGDCLRLGPPADCEFRNAGRATCRYIVAVLRR